MKRLFHAPALALLFCLPVACEQAEAPQVIKHDLKVVLHPEEQGLAVEDTLTLPEGLLPEFRFMLHRGLAPVSATPGVEIVLEGTGNAEVPFEIYKARLPRGSNTFTLKYEGLLFHPVSEAGREYARGFRGSPGIISAEGVYLARSSCWYPRVDDEPVVFSLVVELPPGRDAVSQGSRTLHEKTPDKTRAGWSVDAPQEEIYLVAGRFTEYAEMQGDNAAMVFLRRPDHGLAAKYLDATRRYLAMYEGLLGPYPYGKFALVENFWETGYGMPSFTLLGPQVIRFPFIISSSYPHEILHNWWGNGVYPDLARGNWSEGLTAYLSDHLLKEQEGKGAEYREATLQKYADYASAERDFPLSEFLSRHGSSTEAVGYGKSLMLFHMLRLRIGDSAFKAGLGDFYEKYKFRKASFADIQKSFEKASGRDLSAFFEQWVSRTGAPQLRLSRAMAEQSGEGYVLSALIEQVQPGQAYALRVPLAVTLEGKEEAFWKVLPMEGGRLEVNIALPSRPLRLDVDPEFDVFRSLGLREMPPAITRALGAKRMLVVLPSGAKAKTLEAYKALAKSLAGSGPESVETRLDSELEALPVDRAVAVLGWENRFFDAVETALSGYDVSFGTDAVRIGGQTIPGVNHSVVLAARNPQNENSALLFIANDPPRAAAGLGRKLPHYHKYSYLGFEGGEPENTAKGRWPVLGSPMTAFLAEEGRPMKLAKTPARKPLAELPPVFSEERMMETVRFLSGEELAGRGAGTEGLSRAAEFIAGEFKKAGLEPLGDEGSYFQMWEGDGPSGEITLKNVLGVLPGAKAELSGESVVVAAHYDHLGLGWPEAREGNRGEIHPGADDNASGVAVLLELARVMGRGPKPDRAVVFAAFSAEEAGRRGSRHYVAARKEHPVEKCAAMLNLDTVGRLGSNRLLVLGAHTARQWAYIFRGAGYVTGVEVEMVPEKLDSSDNVSFEEAGVPAVQLFSGPHLDYHRPTDTADKIDSGGLVKVASVAKEAIEYLAGAGASIAFETKGAATASPATKKGRAVSLGTIPDFSYRGEGCRITGVAPDSPAEACGLRPGDVIIRVNDKAVRGLRDLSDALKSLSPGEKITVTFLRDGRETTVDAEVAAR